MAGSYSGQITITEYMDYISKAHPVKIRGLCDDAFCPECGNLLDDLKYKDCIKCPWCGVRVDWTPWHRVNDDEE